MSEREHFEDLARAIEEADDSLVAALDKRARAIADLVALRERDPEGFYRLPRDVEYVGRARERAQDFPSEAVELVLREVLGFCEQMVGPRRVVFLGEPGGFAHLAARRHFGRAAEFAGADAIGTVFEEVTRQRARFGVVPLETSSDGALTATLLGLSESDLRVCAELTVPTSYHLLSVTGNPTDIEKICGSRPALAMCERFLRTEYPRASVIDVASVEVAAEIIRGDHGAALVGTELLQELHGLKSARERIEDHASVQTRYAIVGTDLASRTGQDRTIIAVAVHDEPGALYQCLSPFATRGINLTRVESRPTPGAAWRYLFFVEMDGHVTDRSVLTALEELRGFSRYVKVLGSYPRP